MKCFNKLYLKENKVLVLLTLLCLFLGITSIYFYSRFKSFGLSISNATDIAQYSEQIQILREELDNCRSGSLLIDSSQWKEFQATEWGIRMKCPDEWSCKEFDSNNIELIGREDSYGNSVHISLNISKLRDQDLKHPNYSSIIQWYEDLNQKNKLAVYYDFDRRYGAVQVPGTDAFIFPFYSSYDLKTLKPLILGKNPALMIESPGNDSLDVLMKEDDNVYRILISPIKSKNEDILIPFLSTVEI